MHGYRAPRAFDGEKVRSDGALVLVDDGRIVGVEAAGFPAPADCPVIDLPDTTLLPGLIDAHVHLCGDDSFQALDRFLELDDAAIDAVVTTSMAAQLAGGVTAVRDLGDARWAVADRHRGLDDGPTVVASGPPITCVGGHCGNMGGEVSGAEGLRRAVRERVEHGVDVVKIMTSGGAMTVTTDVLACQFTLEEVRLVVREAHAAGLRVTAHAHALPAVEMSVAAGVDGIEHCSCLTLGRVHMPHALADAIAAAGITVCPTVGLVPGMEPPPHVRAVMARTGMTPEARREQVGRMHRAGVAMISGADSGIGPAKRHGVLPESVIELVHAGLPPVGALASATSGAAVGVGLEGRTGRLAAGLDADLIAVGGDPLADITALRDLRLVVSRGREVVSAGRGASAGQ